MLANCVWITDPAHPICGEYGLFATHIFSKGEELGGMYSGKIVWNTDDVSDGNKYLFDLPQSKVTGQILDGDQTMFFGVQRI